jgi:hypothetical protein
MPKYDKWRVANLGRICQNTTTGEIKIWGEYAKIRQLERCKFRENMPKYDNWRCKFRANMPKYDYWRDTNLGRICQNTTTREMQIWGEYAKIFTLYV